MASTHFLNGRLGRLTRDYEFSRLHEEWMASVYALIVPTGRRHQRFHPTSAAAAAGPEDPQAAGSHHVGGQAG